MANEKRLIDVSALGIGRCNPDAFPVGNRGYCAGWNDVINLLEQAPTADAVEVVRCRDCANSRKLNRKNRKEKEYVAGCVWCEIYATGKWENDFCSDGESRDEKRGEYA